jgi:DedD protein
MAEQDTSPDADLQLKKRARRRLVGAVALALFAVIILPMVMDREPRPLSQDIQVRIPSQDSTGLASRVIPGKPAATPMPAPESKPAA